MPRDQPSRMLWDRVRHRLVRRVQNPGLIVRVAGRCGAVDGNLDAHALAGERRSSSPCWLTGSRRQHTLPVVVMHTGQTLIGDVR